MTPLTGNKIIEAEKIRSITLKKVAARLPREIETLSNMVEDDDGSRNLSKVRLRLAAYNELIHRMENISSAYWWTTIGNKIISNANDLRMFAADVFNLCDDKNSWVGAFERNLF